jgi:CDP-diacylglycerol---glycerol-3-phosphate 3-phosphatidyltransferase
MTKIKTWTPANIVSAMRIGAAPVIVLLMYAEKWANGTGAPAPIAEAKYLWISFVAAAFFLISALSDIVDGYLARKRGEVTDLGKFLDPLADKVVVGTSLIMMVGLDWIPAWIAIAIIMREIAITALRSMASAEGLIIAAGPWGKAKTVVQSTAITILILRYDYFGLPVYLLGQITLYVALLLTLYSGWDYMKAYFTSRNEQ